MNLPASRLGEVSALLPLKQSPTVSHLVNSEFLAVSATCGPRCFRQPCLMSQRVV